MAELTPMKLAIVGCHRWLKPAYAESQAKSILRAFVVCYEPVEIISGGADCVDRWAEEIADELAIPKNILLPQNQRWAPDGYQKRNIEIARACTHLVAMRCSSGPCVVTKTYGSGYTADIAEASGKLVVRRYLIDR